METKLVSVSKEFDWEMAHRLPFHKGKCQNLHGHSYKLRLTVAGTVDMNGLVLDFYDMKQIVHEEIEQLDHATLLNTGDKEYVDIFFKLNTKVVVVPFYTTAENICNYLIGKFAKKMPANIHIITLQVYETIDAYAENTISVNLFKNKK